MVPDHDVIGTYAIGGDQPVERLPQQFISAPRGRAANRAQQVIGHDVERSWYIVDTTTSHIGQNAGAIDQNIGVPDRRHAVIGVGGDMHPQLAVGAAIIDRLDPLEALRLLPFFF